MNAKSKFGHQKLMAMAVVAMFAMCAFSVCLVADSDAGPYGGISENTSDSTKDQVYNVDISTGQEFTYENIKTSLDGIGEPDGTLELKGEIGTLAHDGFSFANLTDDRKISGTFTSPGSCELKLTATWTKHDEGRNVDLTQTATQTFRFTVYQAIEIGATTANGYVVGGQELSDANKVVFSYEGPTTGTTPSRDIQPALSAHTDLFSATLSEGKITVSPKTAIEYKENEDNTYKFDVTMSNTLTGDTQKCTVTYNVYEEIAITNENLTWYTYEKDPNAPPEFVFTNSYETDDSDDTVFDSSDIQLNPGTGALSKDTTNTDKVLINVNNSELVATDELFKNYAATITANGHLGNDGGPTSTATATFNLVVYQFLEFMNKPTVDGVYATPITASGSALTLSSYITAAKTVSINWGDGTQTGSLSAAGASVSNTYSAYHQYSKSGFYTITITATNDMGTTTSQVLYNAGEGNIEIPTDPENPSDDSGKSFFDKHGYQFLIFAILAILLLVAFFFFGIQNPMVIILAVIMIVLAVLCYVCNDIGGIVEAIKGPLGKA